MNALFQVEPWYPHTLLGWLAVIVGYGFTVASSTYTVWRLFIKKPQEEAEMRLLALIDKAETTLRDADKRQVDELARVAQLLHADMAHLGRVKDDLVDHEKKMLEEMGGLKERLKEIETDVKWLRKASDKDGEGHG